MPAHFFKVIYCYYLIWFSLLLMGYMSAKELFLKKVADSQAAKQREKTQLEAAKNEYRQKMLNLGSQIKHWLSGTPLTVSVTSYPLHDDSCFDDYSSSNYELSRITIKHGENVVQIVPTGLFYVGAKGGASMRVHAQNRSPSTKEYTLFMKHSSMPEAKEWIVASSGNYKELTEDLFFELISDIA
ncbi:hypothetical protein C7B09_25455 [Escherichia albertii]|uniref:Uncharacterized protein n=2 Tax=Escherichia albertii TaxID=208962 RepID=A0ABX5HA90_ESCAL|nr:hypothetical protein C7B09_25455 [Escherichia albertii]